MYIHNINIYIYIHFYIIIVIVCVLITLSDFFCFPVFSLLHTCTIWFLQKCNCLIRLEAHTIVMKKNAAKIWWYWSIMYICCIHTISDFKQNAIYFLFFQLNYWNASESRSSHGGIGHVGYTMPCWILNISVQLGIRLHLPVSLNSSETANNFNEYKYHSYFDMVYLYGNNLSLLPCLHHQ